MGLEPESVQGKGKCFVTIFTLSSSGTFFYGLKQVAPIIKTEFELNSQMYFQPCYRRKNSHAQIAMIVYLAKASRRLTLRQEWKPHP